MNHVLNLFIFSYKIWYFSNYFQVDMVRSYDQSCLYGKMKKDTKIKRMLLCDDGVDHGNHFGSIGFNLIDPF